MLQGYKFTYNGLTINDMADVIAFKNRSQDFVITLREASGFSSPAIRNAERDFAGNHGIIDYPSFIGKRVITLSGDIVARTDEAMREAIRTLQVAFSLPAVYTVSETGYRELKWETQGGQDKFKCTAKIQSLPRIDKPTKAQQRRVFFIQLKCEDPRLYSQDVLTVNLKKTWEQAGITLPNYLPVKLGSISVYRMNLVNEGNFGSAPTIRIMGPAINPRITNATYQTSMFFNTTLEEGEYLDIDVFSHSVRDQDGDNRINDVGATAQWIWLQPGDNYIDFTDDRPTGLETGILPEDQVTFTYSYASI